MRNLLRSLLIGLLCTACAEAEDGQVVLLAGALPLSAPPGCTADPSSNTFVAQGIRDFEVNPASEFGYILAPLLVNNTQAVTTNPVAYGPAANYQAESNDFVLDGFNICYDYTSGAPQTGPPPTCAQLTGAPKTYVPATGSALAGGGRAAPVLDVLPPWGFTPPAALSVAGSQTQVQVHLQATGRTEDGRVITSNEMVFPIKLCNGCLDTTAECAALQEIPSPPSICNPGQDGGETCVQPAD